MKLPQYDNRPQPGQPLYSDPSADEREAKGTLLAVVGILCFIGFLIFGIGGGATLLLSFLRGLLH
jgi:hypothetical protein